MSSASSVLWVTLFAAVACSGVFAACASSTQLGADCEFVGCVDGGGADGELGSNDTGTPTNGGSDTGPGTVTPPSDHDSGESLPDDAGAGHPGADAGAGAWVDMDIDASACVDEPNVPCGWSATNNGAGYVCACRDGTWVVGWTCDAPNAPVTAGPSCPGVVGTVDAATGEDAAINDAGVVDSGEVVNSGGVVDSGEVVDSGVADAGGWIDMNIDASACVSEPNVPCGWSTTNNGLGYTCACREGTWAVPWTCELPDAAVVSGPECP